MAVGLAQNVEGHPAGKRNKTSEKGVKGRLVLGLGLCST